MPKIPARVTVGQTSELLVFNYRHAVRAREVTVWQGSKVWLIERFDPLHQIWVWQSEFDSADAALDEARRLSLASH